MSKLENSEHCTVLSKKGQKQKFLKFYDVQDQGRIKKKGPVNEIHISIYQFNVKKVF